MTSELRAYYPSARERTSIEEWMKMRSEQLRQP